MFVGMIIILTIQPTFLIIACIDVNEFHCCTKFSLIVILISAPRILYPNYRQNVLL